MYGATARGEFGVVSEPSRARDGARAMSADGPRVALLVLSGARGRTNAQRRCYQRATLLALVRQQQQQPWVGSWVDVVGVGRFLWRYLVSHNPSNAALQAEAAAFGDLMFVDLVDAPSTCFAKLVAGIRQVLLLNDGHAASDFVAISDDDAWISPPRLMQDLHPLAGLLPRYDIFYGLAAFFPGWDRRHHRNLMPTDQYSVGAKAMHDKFEQRARQRRRGGGSKSLASNARYDGPFPFLYGFAMVLSASLARRVADSEAVARMLHEISATPRPRIRANVDKPGGCDPAGDAALSYAIAHLLPRAHQRPVVLVDVQYANRVQPYLGPPSLVELRTRTAIVHRAYTWEDHFRWSLCESAHPERSAQPDRATVLRCRGEAGVAAEGCGRMGCKGSSSIVYEGSPCAKSTACAAYFRRHFQNWSFCIASGSRRARRAVLPSDHICFWNATRAHHWCAAGGRRTLHER